MGNYSKDPNAVLQEALAKGYDGVRFQQGKPILDRELNLLGDLASPRRLAPYIGNGVPAQDPLSVAMPEDSSVVDFYLMPGRAIMNGLEVVIPERISYRAQPHKENLKNAWPYYYPPNNMGWVVLRVFLAEVDDTADPGLGNQSDIGFETSLRRKVDWELLLVDDTYRPDCLLLAEYTLGPKINPTSIVTWTDRRTQGLTISQLRAEADTTRASLNALSTSLNPDGSPKANVINTAALRDQSVTTLKLANDAVTTTKLASDAVTGQKIASDAVTQTKIANDAVVTAKIANDAIVTTKIANDAVTQSKVAAGAVSFRQLDTSKVYETTYTMSAGAETAAAVVAADKNRLLMFSISTVQNPAGNSITWTDWCGYYSFVPTVAYRGIMIKNRGTTSVDVKIVVYELRNVT